MLDCKEKIWEDAADPAFLMFCALCTTAYKDREVMNARSANEKGHIKNQNTFGNWASKQTDLLVHIRDSTYFPSFHLHPT